MWCCERCQIRCKMMPTLMMALSAKTTMRTTLTLDDSLFADALALADPGMDKAELLRECVKAFIQRQAALRLAALGGAAPEFEAVPRRHLGVDRP